MQIIKTFAPDSAIASTNNLRKINQGFVPQDPSQPGFVTFDPYFPTLGTYTGIEIVPREGCAIALYDLQMKKYYYWGGEIWVESNEPVYQTVEELRPGLSNWTGAMQITIQISSEFFYLSLSCKIGADVFSCLLESALPQLLTTPTIELTLSRESDRNGNIDLGHLNNINSVFWRELPHGDWQEGNLESKAISVSPLTPILLEIKLSCHTEHAYLPYQPQFLPCCVLSPLREENVIYDNSETSIALSHDTSLYISTSRWSDRHINARIMGNFADETRAIAETLYAFLKQEGKIYLAEFGCYFGIVMEGGIKFYPSVPYSCAFNFFIPRIPAGTSDRMDKHPTGINFIFDL